MVCWVTFNKTHPSCWSWNSWNSFLDRIWVLSHIVFKIHIYEWSIYCGAVCKAECFIFVGRCVPIGWHSFFPCYHKASGRCNRSRFLKALLSKSPGIWFCQFCWNLEPCFNQCLILNIKWDGCWGDFLCCFGLLSWQLLWFVTRTKCGGTRNQAWWRILWRCSIMLLITSSSLPNRRYVDVFFWCLQHLCIWRLAEGGSTILVSFCHASVIRIHLWMQNISILWGRNSLLPYVKFLWIKFTICKLVCFLKWQNISANFVSPASSYK